MKEGVDDYPIKTMKESILFTGYKKATLKSVGEISIAAIKRVVEVSGEVDVKVEVSPIGDPETNGEVEKSGADESTPSQNRESALEHNYTISSSESHALAERGSQISHRQKTVHLHGNLRR